LSIYEQMASLEVERVPFAVATVVRTEGSTPQVVGARSTLAVALLPKSRYR